MAGVDTGPRGARTFPVTAKGPAPKVTIAIPTFDRFHYLQQAVESALAQTCRELEVLVGDDGGLPAIPEWCLNRAQADPRLRYFKNPGRLGLAGNWNRLAENARGDYVIFLGDDDVLLPTFVARLLAGLGSNTDVIFCNHHVMDAAGERLPDRTERITREYGRTDLSVGVVPDAAVVAWKQAICPSAVLTRREEVLRLGFRDELNSPDTEFFIRLAEEGAEFRFCPEYLVDFRIHPVSAMATGLRNDRLVHALLAIPVPAHHEELKRVCISRLIMNGVSRALGRGDRALALELLRSGYYPADAPKALAISQRLCAWLPAPAGGWLYRRLLQLNSLAERRRRGVSSAVA